MILCLSNALSIVWSAHRCPGSRYQHLYLVGKGLPGSALLDILHVFRVILLDTSLKDPKVQGSSVCRFIGKGEFLQTRRKISIDSIGSLGGGYPVLRGIYCELTYHSLFPQRLKRLTDAFSGIIEG